MNSFIAISLLCSIVSSVYAEKSIEPSQSILDFIEKNDLVFDIGAHIGNKTSEYLQKGARVVLFEPQPDCSRKLQKRFTNNENVVIEQVGLSAKMGFMDLSICSSANTISTFSENWKNQSRFSERGYKWDKTISVPVTTLDNMIKKHGIPQFCKIDVENGEYGVLKGLSNPVPMISIEFTAELFKCTVQCLDYLSKLGYKHFNFTAGENPHFILKSWINKEELIQEILNYNLSYHLAENDLLWGDIYAYYQ